MTTGSEALSRMVRSSSRPLAPNPTTLIYGGSPSQSFAETPRKAFMTARLIREWEYRFVFASE